MKWLNGYKARIWKVIPLAIMWSIWKLRNEVIFSGRQVGLDDFCDLIKARVAFWVKDHFKGCSYSIQEFIYNLQQIRNMPIS